MLRRRMVVPPCSGAVLAGLPALSDCEITLGHSACKTYYTVMAQKRPDRPTRLKQRGMTPSLCEPSPMLGIMGISGYEKLTAVTDCE